MSTQWKFAVYQVYETEQTWGSKKRHVSNHRTRKAAEKWVNQLNNKWAGCTYVMEPISSAHPQFSDGERVRNQFGETLTVLFQRGCQVFVVEKLAYYHPTKLYKVRTQ